MKSPTPSNNTQLANLKPVNLVMQTAFLGDLLLAIPLMRWTKKLNPQIPLGLICRKGLGSTLKKLGLVDYVFEIEKGNSGSYRDILKQLRDFEIKLLISAHTSFRSTLFCARIKAFRKVTFARPWNFFVFDDRIPWPAEYPEALRLLSLLKKDSAVLEKLFGELPAASDFYKKNENGILLSPPKWANPHHDVGTNQDFKLDASEVSTLLKRFDLVGKKWIALFPGSVWASKMWKTSGFIELGQVLQRQGFKIVVMGGPEEKILGAEVSASISESLNLCGVTSIYESLLLLSAAALVVGNDSSSSHMAAVVGVPVVAVFGPTVLRFGYRPWASLSAAAELENLSCRPCGPHGHSKCPLDHHHCMQLLESREVLRVVEAFKQLGQLRN